MLLVWRHAEFSTDDRLAEPSGNSNDIGGPFVRHSDPGDLLQSPAICEGCPRNLGSLVVFCSVSTTSIQLRRGASDPFRRGQPSLQALSSHPNR